MLLIVLAYLGGALTILSPCVLPVIPFIFARADRPFVKSGLPMFVGMALTFAVVASLATVGGGWAVRANEIGRWVAVVLLGLFAATLLSPWLADRLSRPFVALGGRLTEANAREDNIWQSGLLGVATGLLWAPCAGPILGLILTTAALQGASAKTALLLLVYALGAATSLAVVLLAGKRAMAVFRRSQKAEEWIRRILGVAVLLGVVAIAFGLDRGILAKLSGPGTTALETRLIARLNPQAQSKSNQVLTAGATLPVLGQAADFTGGAPWINSPPLTIASLKGKVVAVDFWTYSCINCLRTLPYVKAWAARYVDQGLVVVGVHAPEFAFEQDPDNVRKAVRDLGITYPVVMDNSWAVMKAYHNNSWPMHAFIDAQGRIRYQHIGEGGYAESEQVIRQLLAERNGKATDGPAAAVDIKGVAVASQNLAALTPETYFGYYRVDRFGSPSGETHDKPKTYQAPSTLMPGHWALIGPWTVNQYYASADRRGAALRMSFHARDVNMVLGPPSGGKPVRFRIRLNGRAPGADHGLDVDANGEGQITGQRLYQLVRQPSGMKDGGFEIEFLDPGAQAFTFTFG
jgi:cytochrome c biogenesis protein CcdA/thiol-disulfide isomerase/thioredoxin